MDKSRTGRLIVSCGGTALVAVAAGLVWYGIARKDRGRPERPEASVLVPVKLGPTEPGGNAGLGVPPSQILPTTGGGGTVSVPEGVPLQTGETYYGKGESFFKSGDFASASRYLEAEVEEHKDRFYPTYLLGISRWKEGRLEEAVASLTSAASLDPGSARARVNLGRVLNDAGRFEEALTAAGEAIAIDPESSAAHNVQGRALLNLGRRDEAIESFKVAVTKDPTNAFAQNNLGYALIQSGRFAEAVPSLEEAVRLRPEVGYFQNNLGMAYEHVAQNDKARVAYGQAVQTGGSDAAKRNLERLGGALDDDSVSTKPEAPSN